MAVAPRPRAAASAEAPALPTCKSLIHKVLTAGSALVPSPAASRCTPSVPAEPELSKRYSVSSADSTDPSEPSNARSAAERPLLYQLACVASRSSLQLCKQALRPSAAAAS
eukprot:scaffold101519_cov60-Phaeocystis_antarctica.AAC.3